MEHSINNPVTQADSLHNVQQPEVLTGQVNGQALSVTDIVGEAVNKPTANEQERNERLELLEATRITTHTEVDPVAYSLTVDGVGIFALSDVHGLKGKQKSGKSAVLKVCAAALLAGQQFRMKSELEEPVVLFLDTEQQAADVKLVIDELKHMTQCTDDYIDRHLLLYTLRRMSYDTLLGDTRLLIEKYSPHVVFIDGLVDYVASFNDEVLSRQLIHNLLVLCEENHCAIVNVLHENKASDDENMRGHLGTVLAQKAGTVLQCQKSRTGIINVSCPDPRHGVMPLWNICFDEEGHIIDADQKKQEEERQRSLKRSEREREKREQRYQERTEAMLHIVRDSGGSITRKELKLRLMQRLKISDSTAQNIIKQNLCQNINEVNGMIYASDDADLFS